MRTVTPLVNESILRRSKVAKDIETGDLNEGIETILELLLSFSESTENKALFTEITGFG